MAHTVTYLMPEYLNGSCGIFVFCRFGYATVPTLVDGHMASYLLGATIDMIPSAIQNPCCSLQTVLGGGQDCSGQEDYVAGVRLGSSVAPTCSRPKKLVFPQPKCWIAAYVHAVFFAN